MGRQRKIDRSIIRINRGEYSRVLHDCNVRKNRLHRAQILYLKYQQTSPDVAFECTPTLMRYVPADTKVSAMYLNAEDIYSHGCCCLLTVIWGWRYNKSDTAWNKRITEAPAVREASRGVAWRLIILIVRHRIGLRQSGVPLSRGPYTVKTHRTCRAFRGDPAV